MTDQRVPTEAEWGLVAGVMGFTFCERVLCEGCDDWTLEPAGLFHGGEGLFDPLADSNDTDRLVRAMQAAGYVVTRRHENNMTTRADVFRHIGTSPVLRRCAPGIGGMQDPGATTFAIIDALAAEEKRKQEKRK